MLPFGSVFCVARACSGQVVKNVKKKNHLTHASQAQLTPRGGQGARHRARIEFPSATARQPLPPSTSEVSSTQALPALPGPSPQGTGPAGKLFLLLRGCCFATLQEVYHSRRQVGGAVRVFRSWRFGAVDRSAHVTRKQMEPVDDFAQAMEATCHTLPEVRCWLVGAIFRRHRVRSWDTGGVPYAL